MECDISCWWLPYRMTLAMTHSGIGDWPFTAVIDLLKDPDVDFTKLSLEEMSNLHVRWARQPPESVTSNWKQSRWI